MKLVNADEQGLRDAALAVRAGGVVVYPTETFYGLGCEPSSPEATRRVCELKERADRPLPLICSDVKTARRVVEFNAAAERLAERFWPGPLSLVLPSKVDYPVWVTRKGATLAVRVPGHEVARRLASLCGGVIVSTSANKSGKEPPTTASGAVEQLGRSVDVVVDGGRTHGGEASTVLDLSGEELWILRAGPVKGEDLLRALRE